jgi:hypothetical protein
LARDAEEATAPVIFDLFGDALKGVDELNPIEPDANVSSIPNLEKHRSI